MSGWIDWYEVKIYCPHCNKKIIVLFYEDGDPERNPVVITGLVENTICPNCKKQLTDKEIN